MKAKAQKSRSNGTKSVGRENVRPQAENAAESKKTGNSGDLQQQLQAAMSQIKVLQAQIKNLNRRKRGLPQEIESTVRLYRDTVKYENKCYEHISRKVRSMTRLCGDEIEDAVYSSYRKNFGKAIDEVKRVLEGEILEALYDEVYFQ